MRNLKIYSVHWLAVIAAVITAIVIEYYMIVMQSYQNFVSAFGWLGGIMVYVYGTVISLLILRVLFYWIETKRFLETYAMTLGMVFPIGFFIAYCIDIKYSMEQLTDPLWEFEHDMVWTVIVSGIVVMVILLIGTRIKEFAVEGYEAEEGQF